MNYSLFVPFMFLLPQFQALVNENIKKRIQEDFGMNQVATESINFMQSKVLESIHFPFFMRRCVSLSLSCVIFLSFSISFLDVSSCKRVCPSVSRSVCPSIPNPFRKRGEMEDLQCRNDDDVWVGVCPSVRPSVGGRF